MKTPADAEPRGLYRANNNNIYACVGVMCAIEMYRYKWDIGLETLIVMKKWVTGENVLDLWPRTGSALNYKY